MKKIYLVGGAVRDKLLGKTVQDRDFVVVGSSEKEMLDNGFIPVGRDFPVFLHPETKEEYALARTERKVNKGYAGFTFSTDKSVSLKDDLSRRDLTINAMAEDENGNIIDPFGGQKDLQQGILRHVSNAFVEDPVRILRIARFVARYQFSIAPETMRLMKNMVANGEVDALVPERVWQEISRGLMENKPSLMFYTLRECGALKIILSEIDALFGIEQRADYHPEIDCGIHTMMTIDYAAQHNFTLAQRYAALTHDLGKASTPLDILPKHYGHEQAGIKPLQNVNKRLNVPKQCAKLALIFTQNHGLFHSVSELKATTIVDILHRCDAFRQPERFISAIEVGFADTRGRLGFENKEYPQYETWKKYLNACLSLDIPKLIEQAQQSQDIAQIIRQKRIDIIKQQKAI